VRLHLDFQTLLSQLSNKKADVLRRAGLNERETPGKVVTARPPKRLVQLCTISHALVSTLQKDRSKPSKLIRVGSLHFWDNWGEHVRRFSCG